MSETVTEKFEMRIMDKDQGDIKMEWDQDRPDEVAAAREAFDKAKKKGMLFYRMKRDGSAGEVIREFTPSAERIIGMPMVQGG